MSDPTEHVRSPGEQPSHIGKSEPLSLTERATFGVDSPGRCPHTGHPYEVGSGALSREKQSLLFRAEAAAGRRLNEFEAQLLFARAKEKI
jgi:hypothetical protein